MEQYKTCTRCKQTFLVNEINFHRNKKSPDGFRPDCKTCNKNRSLEYSRKNAEANRQRVAKWRAKNPELTKEKRRNSYQKHQKEIRKRWKQKYKQNPELYKVSARTRRARVKGLPSEKYTWQDVVNKWGSICHLCQEPIDLRAPRAMKYPGWELGLHLDHVIGIAEGGPNTLENVKPAHGICNLRKPRKNKD